MERKVNVIPRARRALINIASEDGKFMSYVLHLLHTESVDNIYNDYGARWKTQKAIPGAHLFKIAQKIGAGGVVVLAMVPKDIGDRAIIVNVFRRTHKGGRFYLSTADDIEQLRVMDDDLAALIAACA